MAMGFGAIFVWIVLGLAAVIG